MTWGTCNLCTTAYICGHGHALLTFGCIEQEGRYSKTALSQFASIDAKNKAIGCTLLEARTSQEQLKHHAEVAVEPFTVPRAMGGANLTRLLEKPPVSGSVPLATVLRPATTRGSPRQQSESSGLHIMQSALASLPAPELSEEQRQSELLHLAFLPTSAQVSRAHLRNSIDIKHPTRLSSSFAAKSLRNPFPSESQPSLIGASERVAKRRAETRQASPRRVQSESSSMLSLVNEGLAIGPIKVVKVHRGTDDELDIMGRPGSRGSSSARSSSSPASPYSRSKRLQFVEEKGARQLHTGANNSSMSLDCAPHDHHHSPPIQPSDNWGFGWSSHGLSSEDTAASPEVALSAFAWTRRRPILSSTTRAKRAAAASPRASPRLGQSAAALRPLRLKMDGVVSVETGDASPRRPQPGATPHHGSSSYSATVRALSSGRALPGQSSQYAAAAAAAAAAKVHPAAHGASTHRSSGSSVANWSTKPYASSSPLHGSPRNAGHASTLAAHRRRKQPAPLAGLMPPVPGPWTSPRAQLHTHRGGGGQLSASASIPNTHRSASPPVPVYKSGAEADLVRVAGGGGGGVGAAF